MFGILGSEVKELILMYLGLRGGASGRKLGRATHKGVTQVFKALKQLEKNQIIIKSQKPFMYVLNPEYVYYPELLSMIQKNQHRHPRKFPFLPVISASRKVDPISVYEFIELRGNQTPIEKFSDVLRTKYA